ncbi:MAG: hypothetical protein FJZ63_00945 [Chlamydiae bacterium]|nr:hypothetical protein [Chlamydiota bacterium]
MNAITYHLTRVFTLEILDDYRRLSSERKQDVIDKVLIVGLTALGISLAAGMLFAKVIWGIPLIVILAAGTSFTLLTNPEYLAKQARKGLSSQ